MADDINIKPIEGGFIVTVGGMERFCKTADEANALVKKQLNKPRVFKEVPSDEPSTNEG